MGQADTDRVDAASAAASAGGAGAATATLAPDPLGRPEPGSLARGVWEAPPWAFYATAAVVLVAALLFGARFAGILRRRRPRDS